MDGWMDGWMDGRTDGRTDRRKDGRSDRQTDGRAERFEILKAFKMSIVSWVVTPCTTSVVGCCQRYRKNDPLYLQG
jgi:hypothetical protein